MKKKDKEEINNEKPRKVRLHAILWAIAISVVVFLIAGNLALCLAAEKKFQSNAAAFSDFKGDNPQLVFETVDFYKYLIHGSPEGDSNKLDRLVIYNISGTAEFSFNLNAVSFELDGYRICAVIDDLQGFPVNVNVIVPPEKCIRIDEIEPEPISSEEASAAGKVVAVVTGTFGSAIGGMGGNAVGSAVGSFFGPVGSMISKTVGMVLGGGTGAILGGKAGFDMTNNFLIERRLVSEIQMTQVEQMIENAKILVALELMSEYDNVKSYELFSRNSPSGIDLSGEWKEATRRPYQIELERTLRDLVKQMGYRDVQIRYKSGARVLTDRNGKEVK